MAGACNLLYMPCAQIKDHHFLRHFRLQPTSWQRPQVMQHTSDFEAKGTSLQIVCASDGASQQATAQRGEGHNGNAQLAAGGDYFFLECKPRILACRRSLSLAELGLQIAKHITGEACSMGHGGPDHPGNM